MNPHPIPNAALEKHVAILGKTGSGKSNLAKVITEGLLAKRARVCVLDPTGTWFGIRLQRDGKKPSPFSIAIFGGVHADLPIGQAHGAAIAEAVGTSSSSVIIDTRLMTVGGRTRFFTDFAEALLRKNHGPLHVVIDEAHLFVPQGKVNDPQSGKMLHAGNNLVSLGRGNGLRIIMVSQRPKLHKDSLSQIETLVAMRLVAPQDRRAIDDWIGEWADPAEGRELIASLPSLKTGDGWVWSPESGILRRDHFPLAATFDSGKPGAGSSPTLAPINIAAIADKLETVAAEAKANDPRALRDELASLKKQMADGVKRQVVDDPAEIDAAERRGYERGYGEGQRHGFVRGHERARHQLAELVNRVEAREDDIAPENAPWETVKPFKRAVAPAPKPQVRPRAKAQTNGSASAVSRPHQRILDAVAFWEVLGFDAPTRVQVAFVAGYKPNTGTFNTYLGAMSTAGLVSYPAPGRVSLTTEGDHLANSPRERPSLSDLHERVNAILSGPQRRLLAPLIEAYPAAISRDELATAANYQPNTGTFNTYVGSLSTLEIVEYPQRGHVAAAAWLFPERGNG